MKTNRRIGGHVSCAGGLQNAITNTLAIGGNCLQIFAGALACGPALCIQKEALSFKLLALSNNIHPSISTHST